MNIVNGWLLTECAIDDRQLQELNIEQEGDWEQCAVKLDTVIAFRPNVYGDGSVRGTILYTAIGEDFIVNESHDDLVIAFTKRHYETA
jgi:hypothetical protein